MSRDALLAEAQAFAEEGMADTCTIRRVTGKSTDPFSGQDTDTYLSPDPYSGKCRVQASLAQAAQHTAGEDYQLQIRLELQLPVSATGFQVGDQVTITASRDADLVGRVFLIRDLMHKTDASSRRIGITERTS